MRGRLAWVVLSGLLFAAGCTSVGQGPPLEELPVVPGQTTREQLYERMGLPQAVAVHANGVETLVYRHVQARGLGMGLAVYLSRLEIGNRRTTTRSIFIDLSRAGVVVGMRRNEGAEEPGYGLWPWGSGADD